MFQKIFLSVYNLKSAISIGTVVTLLIGIGLLFVLVYAFIISSVTAQIQSNFRNVFIGFFLTSSIMMIVSSITAIYGLIRKKYKFLVFYAITMVLYFISFIILGVYSDDLPGKLQTQCNQYPEHSQFNIAFKAANNTLCKQDCACYFPEFLKYDLKRQGIINRMGATNRIDNQTYPVNVETCKNWSNSTFSVTQQLLMIESFFSCSGWCNVNSDFNLYYLFSDINHGIPQKSCLEAVIQFFNKFGVILQISCFSVSIILFLILLNILCLCCHPKKSRQYDALKFFKQTLVNKDTLQQNQEDIPSNNQHYHQIHDSKSS